ncbi:MAG TPA: biotin--[acetyl-CoA-carboxylase] ligase [Candidatus Polarisedimenticolaceae bacterium]|nr:biotin--[acetyl-CoA-carboxylase] ligase [Candidatus Polarisedimenticolaceae bacterium]
MTPFDPAPLADELALSGFARRVVVLDATGSTNDDARLLAADGAPEGTVVIARRQTSGRGRRGRVWESPEGLGLYLSVVLRPTEPAALIGRYAIASAVAAVEACRRFAGDRVEAKWPNDLFAGGRKLAGILAEVRSASFGTEMVVGFGVNVLQGERDFPPELRGEATSLRLLRGGEGATPGAVARVLVEALGRQVGALRSGAWEDVARLFLACAPGVSGRRARLASGGEGVTDGIDASGALRVMTPGGAVLVHAGESVEILEG